MNLEYCIYFLTCNEKRILKLNISHKLKKWKKPNKFKLVSVTSSCTGLKDINRSEKWNEIICTAINNIGLSYCKAKVKLIFKYLIINMGIWETMG